MSRYRPYYAANLRLALPVALAQLGQVTVQLADNAMVGRYGGTDPLPLAAVSLGGAVAFIPFIIGIGIAMGLTPLVGELFARSDTERSSQLLQNGIVFYTLTGIALLLAQLLFIPCIYHLGQPVDVVDMSLPYYRMLCYSMPFVMLFGAFKQFLEGVGNTTLVTFVTVLSNLLNIGLNFIFIYGMWGIPEYGAEGAGIATLISRIALPLLLIPIFISRRRYRLYLRGFGLRLHGAAVRRLLTTGIPIAAQMFLEAGAFVGTGLLMGLFGQTAIGANQITTTVANCAFMIVMAVGAATTILVSHRYGERNIRELRLTVGASYRLGLLWNLFTALIFIIFRNHIPLLFTANAEVIQLTSRLLLFVALFQLSDGLQNISVGTLRGIQDVKIIMPIAFLAYLVLNIPAGCLFGFVLGMGPEGLILGFTFGLTAAALLMMLRIRRRLRHLSACSESVCGK